MRTDVIERFNAELSGTIKEAHDLLDHYRREIEQLEAFLHMASRLATTGPTGPISPDRAGPSRSGDKISALRQAMAKADDPSGKEASG